MRLFGRRLETDRRLALERELSRALRPATLPEERALAIRVALQGEEPRRRHRTWMVPAVAALLIVPATFAWRGRQAPRLEVAPAGAPTSTFERMALALHERGLSADGATLLTASAAEARAWGRARTGVDVNLPAVRPVEDDGAFAVRGVRAVAYRGAAAVAVTYAVDGRPVTLTAARAEDVPDRAPAWTLAGKRVRAHEAGGHRILSWTNSGQSYVLVADLPGDGRRACFVCHTQPARRQLIDGLEP